MNFKKIVSGLLCGAALMSYGAEYFKPGSTFNLGESVKNITRKTRSFGMEKFPVMMWNYVDLGSDVEYLGTPEEVVDQWNAAGFTVPQGPKFSVDNPDQVEYIKRMLAQAKKYGMKIVLHPKFINPQSVTMEEIEREHKALVEKLLALFGKSSAVFGIVGPDEPVAEWRDNAFRITEIHNQMTPTWFNLLNLLPWWYPNKEEDCSTIVGSKSWSDYLDEYVKGTKAHFISYDMYHQMNPGDAGWNAYFNNLRYYQEAALRNNVPYWNTILSVGHFQYRCPNYDELNWQFNTALAGGAQGITWFMYYNNRNYDLNYRLAPVDELGDKTQTWHDLRRIQQRFHRIYGNLFTKIVNYRMEFYGKVYGENHQFAPNKIVKAIKPLSGNVNLMVSYFTDIKNRKYVMFVNNTVERFGSCKVDVVFPASKLTGWNHNGEEQPWAIGAGWRFDDDKTKDITIRLLLAPGQEAIFRVESEDVDGLNIAIDEFIK